VRGMVAYSDLLESTSLRGSLDSRGNFNYHLNFLLKNSALLEACRKHMHGTYIFDTVKIRVSVLFAVSLQPCVRVRIMALRPWA